LILSRRAFLRSKGLTGVTGAGAGIGAGIEELGMVGRRGAAPATRAMAMAAIPVRKRTMGRRDVIP
jgi:hypothetical protein